MIPSFFCLLGYDSFSFQLSHDVLLCNWDAGNYSLANDDKEEVNDPDSEENEDCIVQKVNGF